MSLLREKLDAISLTTKALPWMQVWANQQHLPLRLLTLPLRYNPAAHPSSSHWLFTKVKTEAPSFTKEMVTGVAQADGPYLIEGWQGILPPITT